VVIPTGQASVTLSVNIVDDATAENDETVILSLATNAIYSIGAAGSATVTIIDDETPVVTVTLGTNAIEGTQGGNFAVAREGNTLGSLTVTYTVSGTATSGSDFTALSGTVTIPVGASVASVAVAAVNDTVAENDESVVLTITADAGYSVGAADNATVLIIDNEKPLVSIVATDAIASEPGTNKGTFTITRVGTTAAALTVALKAGGTAKSALDYDALPISVTIPAGDSAVTVETTVIDDPAVEADETATLSVLAGTTYTLGTPSTASVTIQDDEPTLTIAATDASASEFGPDAGEFTITRTGSTVYELIVKYSIGGTAKSGTDYTALTASVTIPAGQSSAVITLTPIEEQIAEPDETVILTLALNSAGCGDSHDSG
jgi:hypothetical protein